MAEKLQAGDPAPNFESEIESGERKSLDDFRGQWLVLYFYPKDDTPGCTIQACSFRDNYQALTSQNAIVLGVSPDDEESHQRFKEKFSLPFPLLVDTDHEIAEAYGVWVERSRDGKSWMGINRSQFVIDPEGKIAEARYGIRPEESVPTALEVISAE